MVGFRVMFSYLCKCLCGLPSFAPRRSITSSAPNSILLDCWTGKRRMSPLKALARVAWRALSFIRNTGGRAEPPKATLALPTLGKFVDTA
jgi:hypothetical protein